MATTNVGILIPATTAHELTNVNDVTASDIPLQGVIAGDILTAVAAGLFTTSASVTGYNSLQVQSLINALNGLGYGVSYSGHTITLTW